MNKAIYAIIGILVVAGIVILFSNKQNKPASDNLTPATSAVTENNTSSNTASSTTKDQAEKSKSKTVIYTDSGFSPASLTIAVGDTVTFTNESNNLMWVASDPHPTHTGLPGFDSSRGISQSNSYSFTFTKAGRFGFHNHLNTAQTGTIISQ